MNRRVAKYYVREGLVPGEGRYYTYKNADFWTHQKNDMHSFGVNYKHAREIADERGGRVITVYRKPKTSMQQLN